VSEAKPICEGTRLLVSIYRKAFMRHIGRLVGTSALLALAMVVGWMALSIGIAVGGGSAAADALARVSYQVPRLWSSLLPIGAFLVGKHGQASRNWPDARSTFVASILLAATALVSIEYVGPRMALHAEHGAVSPAAPVVENLSAVELYRLHSANDVIRSQVHGRFSKERMFASRLDWEWSYRLALAAVVFFALLIGHRISVMTHHSDRTRIWEASLALVLLLHLVIGTVGGQELTEQFGVPAAIPAFFLVFLPATVLLGLGCPVHRSSNRD
jgi:hypothetical protein